MTDLTVEGHPKPYFAASLVGSNPVGNAFDLAPGVTIDGRYRLIAPLGEGTFGDVWRASDARLSQRVVAVKVLKPEFFSRPEIVQRFEAEADALASVQHPNVVGLFDRGRWGQRHYLVTEFVEGRPLTAWIEEHRSRASYPDIGAVLALFDQVCAGVEAAHTVRVPGPIVHRDLKPDNVLLRVQLNGEPLVKLVDFGIAQLGGRSGTRTGALMGTPIYMAPEQAMGNTAGIGPWTDVFALGVILVEMLTLRPQADLAEPWWGTALQREGEVRGLLTSLRGDVPEGLWTVVAATLRARGVDRPSSAGALRVALRACAERPSAMGFARTVMAQTQGASPPMRTVVSAPPPPMAQPQLRAAPVVNSTTAPTTRDSPQGATPQRSALVPAVLASVAVSGLGAALYAAASGRRGGASTSPIETSPTATATAPQATTHGCIVSSQSSFHLRPTETIASVGTEYPVGTQLEVLGAGSLTRRGDTILRVRVVADGAVGWMFLRPEEMATCSIGATPPPTATPVVVAPSATPLPLNTDPALRSFFDRWSQAVLVDHGTSDLSAYYADSVQFRGSGAVADAPSIARYYVTRASAGTFDIDWSRSVWLTDDAASPDVPRTCLGGVESVVKVRAWATEVVYDRDRSTGGAVPCDRLEGIYLFRMRRVGGALQICHETWTVREGICASCPAAHACQSLN